VQVCWAPPPSQTPPAYYRLYADGRQVATADTPYIDLAGGGFTGDELFTVDAVDGDGTVSQSYQTFNAQFRPVSTRASSAWTLAITGVGGVAALLVSRRRRTATRIR
jgi:hypothetical protein